MPPVRVVGHHGDTLYDESRSKREAAEHEHVAFLDHVAADARDRPAPSQASGAWPVGQKHQVEGDHEDRDHDRDDGQQACRTTVLGHEPTQDHPRLPGDPQPLQIQLLPVKHRAPKDAVVLELQPCVEHGDRDGEDDGEQHDAVDRGEFCRLDVSVFAREARVPQHSAVVRLRLTLGQRAALVHDSLGRRVGEELSERGGVGGSLSMR
mmetsp:Transcript_23589/g.53975  ORF Transcript_23589/g.53975 Transcript_23589/m.53975 type:complete len:208 (+) Transcript_23589:1109-1732(+)